MLEFKITARLFELTKTIRDNTPEFLSFTNDEARKRLELYTKTKGNITEYNKGVKAISWSTESYNQEDVQWISFEKYIDRLGQKFKILQDCVAAIQSQFQLDQSSSKIKLGSFINYLLYDQKQAPTDDRVAEVVSIFINDLNNIPPNWKIKLWVKGIYVDDKEIKINNYLSIRKPVSEDFDNVTKPIYDWLMPFPNTSFEHCDCIIEYDFIRTEIRQVNLQVNKLIKALCLFRVGSVNIVKSQFTPNAILKQLRSTGPTQNYSSDHSYQIKGGDESKLQQFLDSIISFFPEIGWENKENKNNPIYISIDRYFDALLKIQYPESKITNIITCLEALFLKGHERSELTHKLSQRVAYLVSVSGEPPIKVYNTLRRAYDVRSTYIHGSMLKADEKKDLKDIGNYTINCARKAIIFFIKFSDTNSKEDILTKIDNAILDESANRKFKDELEKIKYLL